MQFGLAACAAAFPDRTALVLDARRQSYAHHNARVNRLANGLRAAGLEPGDKIATLLKNSFECFEVSNAATRLGAIVVPINYHFKSAEVEYIVDNSDAKVFVYGGEFLTRDVLDPIRTRLAKVWLQLCVGEAPPGTRGYEDFLAQQTDTDAGTGTLAAAPATMVYTSGTTGQPKGVYRRPSDVSQTR